MPTIPFFQIDAFTDRPFAGNPAAVCPMDAFAPDDVLQAIACENNLSETAFVVARDDGDFDLRWFTPAHEVDLCGHATLASGHVVLSRLRPEAKRVGFHTRSGLLLVERAGGDGYLMDMPAQVPVPTEAPAGLAAALGDAPIQVLAARYLVAVFKNAEAVRALKPDFGAMAKLDVYAVCATAPGTGDDADVAFVSRLFAPRAGIDEDPVTGSAHCILAPYWGSRLDRAGMKARQVSARTGELHCALAGDRVLLTGNDVQVIEGTLTW